MTAYEFQAAVNDGTIRIPVEYRNKLAPSVKVILLSEETNVRHKDFTLMNNPLHVESLKRYSREELNER